MINHIQIYNNKLSIKIYPTCLILCLSTLPTSINYYKFLSFQYIYIRFQQHIPLFSIKFFAIQFNIYILQSLLPQFFINIIFMQNQLPKTQFTEQSYRYTHSILCRWVILFVFALSTTVMGINTVLVPSIATTLKYYTYAIFIYICYLQSTCKLFYRLKRSKTWCIYFLNKLNIGSAIFILGNAICMLINQNFYMLILGSILIAIAQPFIFNCTAKIPTFWFFKQKRNSMVTFLALINLVGTAVGLVIPTLIVDQNATIEVGLSQTFILCLVQFIFALVSGILVFFFMRDKPNIAPSLGGETDKTPFKQSLKILYKNSNFMLLTVGYLFLNAPIFTISGLLNFIMTPYNFTNFQISIFGVLLLVSGILGSFAVSYFLTKSLNYTFISNILGWSTVLVTIVFYLCMLYYAKYEILLLFMFLIGLFVTPLYPLGFDFGCQIAFPIGEAQITGLLNSVVYFTSFLLLLINQLAIGFGTKNQSTNNFLVFLICYIIGAILYLFVKNDIRRRKLEDTYDTIQNIEQKKGIEIQMKSNPNLTIDMIAQKKKVDNNIQVQPIDQEGVVNDK